MVYFCKISHVCVIPCFFIVLSDLAEDVVLSFHEPIL